MSTFRIVVAYDGTGFVGWQRQPSGTSIQGLVEEALRALDGRNVTVTGAGRTDAGVHALGQVASFSLERDVDADTVVRALNARLPASVRVCSARLVTADFNARFAARAKSYRYRICHGPIISPFERQYAWHITGPLDIESMAAAARQLEGRHDFAAFQATGSDVATTERTVTKSRISLTTEDAEDAEEQSTMVEGGLDAGFDLRVLRVLRGVRLITYDVTADGFLRHMVRNIVGTLIEIGRGRRGADTLDALLAARDRTLAGPTAPAHGLFLVGVDYGEQTSL